MPGMTGMPGMTVEPGMTGMPETRSILGLGVAEWPQDDR